MSCRCNAAETVSLSIKMKSQTAKHLKSHNQTLGGEKMTCHQFQWMTEWLLTLTCLSSGGRPVWLLGLQKSRHSLFCWAEVKRTVRVIWTNVVQVKHFILSFTLWRGTMKSSGLCYSSRSSRWAVCTSNKL